uniref:DNA-directed RNA polymerase III subunit 2 n=1 Tax=Tanacetum cinerariifolium TaxID=118510 RepID=A0A6L2NAQ3_TANCI|nr:DNA-directed RNA polymerase III subunit 2 [Tanacetum cinerariifolium]
MEKEKISLVLTSFTTKVPIMVVMKAMGMEADQEVVQMLGRDPQYAALLLPSIEECASAGVYTQQQALEFLEKKDLFKTMNEDIKNMVEKLLYKNNRSSRFDISQVRQFD